MFTPLVNNYLGEDLTSYYDKYAIEAFKSLHSAMLHYIWVFTVMPLVAAVVLGLVQSVHEKNCETMAKAAKKEEAETQGNDNLLRNSINHD